MPKKVAPRGRKARIPVGEDSGAAPPSREKAKAGANKKALPTRPGGYNFYLRNIRNIPVSLRLSNTSERRIELAPRGRRGDMTAISDDELYDEVNLVNLGLTHEILKTDEALKVISKQSTNAQAPDGFNPLLNILRDAKGEAITKVTVEKSNTETEIVTGSVDEKGNIDRSVDQSEAASVKTGVAPQRANIPGTEDNPLPTVPDNVPPEQVGHWQAQQGDPVAYIDALRAELPENQEQD